MIRDLAKFRISGDFVGERLVGFRRPGGGESTIGNIAIAT